MGLRIKDFNPFSNQHAIDHFKKDVSPENKLKIRVATFFAALLTLPLLGIGGVAVFRALTRKYSVIKLDSNSQESSPTRKTDSSARNVDTSVGKTAQKTQNQYIRATEHFFETKGKKLIDDTGYSSLTSEGDTFFKIASESLGVSQKELLQDMKNFIENNSDKVQLMFEKFKFSNLTLKEFKAFLLNENVSKTLIKQHGADKLLLGIPLQTCINQTRCDLLSQMRDVKIVLHNINILHAEGMEIANPMPGMSISPDNKSMQTGETGQKVFGNDKSNKTIELVLGSISYSKFSDRLTGDQIFIQPRKLEGEVKTVSKGAQIYDTFKSCSKSEALKILEEQRPNLNAKGAGGNTLIHIACMREGFDEVVDKMLDVGDANFDARNDDGDMPILSYSKSHRREQNEKLNEKMVLKMNQPDFLESAMLTKNDPVYLRKVLQKLTDLGKPYQLKAYTDTVELFVVLLERAQEKDEISNIAKYYQKPRDLGSADFFGEDKPIRKQVEKLVTAINTSDKFNAFEKAGVTTKLNQLI